MYFHVPEHVYVTYYNNEIMALDLCKDQYIFIPSNLSEVIYIALNNEFKKVKGRYIPANQNKISLPEKFAQSIKNLQKLKLGNVRNFKITGFIDWNNSIREQNERNNSFAKIVRNPHLRTRIPKMNFVQF